MAAFWADIPGLSSRVSSWPWSWQQVWQQSSTCLQSDVSARVSGSDLGNRLFLSDRDVPLGTEVMAR